MILSIAKHYDKDIRKCRDTKGNVVVDLSLEMLVLTFKITQFEEVLQTIQEEVVREFNINVDVNKDYANNSWLREPQKIGLKAIDNIHRTNSKMLLVISTLC